MFNNKNTLNENEVGIAFKSRIKLSYSSLETDSSISIKKVKLIKRIHGKFKKYTRYFVKVGKELYEFRNKKLNIKKFQLKKLTIR